MAITIFYSWQSDSNNKLNRAFIEDALEKSIQSLGTDLEIVEALRDETISLDKDTKGLPGSPPIVESILRKIESAEIFIGDLTFIASNNQRQVSNPNVLIEYGWALAKLGHDKVICVMNGNPQEIIPNLPFDMRHLRAPITYQLNGSETPTEKKRIKDKLVKDLSAAIKTIISNRKPEDNIIPLAHTPMQPKHQKSSFINAGEVLNESVSYYDNEKHNIYWGGNEAQLFLRVIPVNKTDEIPLVKLEKLAKGNDGIIPLGRVRGITWDINEYGVVAYEPPRGDRDITRNITQISEYGEIWGIDAYMPENIIPYFEEQLSKHLEQYLTFLKDKLNMKGPVNIIVGITGFKGAPIILPPLPAGRSWRNKSAGNCVKDEIIVEFNNVEIDADPKQLLEKFFSKVYDLCGLDREEILTTVKGDKKQ